MSQYMSPASSRNDDSSEYGPNRPPPLPVFLRIARFLWILTGAATLIGGSHFLVMALMGRVAGTQVFVGAWLTLLPIAAGLLLLSPLAGSRSLRGRANFALGRWFFCPTLLGAISLIGTVLTFLGLGSRSMLTDETLNYVIIAFLASGMLNTTALAVGLPALRDRQARQQRQPAQR